MVAGTTVMQLLHSNRQEALGINKVTPKYLIYYTFVLQFRAIVADATIFEIRLRGNCTQGPNTRPRVESRNDEY